AEVSQCPVNLLGTGAFFQQETRFAPVASEHAVADEAFAYADQHVDLADALRHVHAGCNDVGAGLVAAYDFKQLHDVGGAEKVQADDGCRSAGAGGNLVDVQAGRIGGQYGIRLADGVQLLEN